MSLSGSILTTQESTWGPNSRTEQCMKLKFGSREAQNTYEDYIDNIILQYMVDNNKKNKNRYTNTVVSSRGQSPKMARQAGCLCTRIRS